jgi:SEC-C motif
MDINASGSTEVVASETSPEQVAAARARLKSGRNDPCPCGSGRKFKKCCLASDEQLVRNAEATRRAQAFTSAPPPPAVEPPPAGTPKVKERKPRPLTEAEVRWNAFWDELEALNSPSAAQMHDLLGKLLESPEGDDWADLMHAFAKHNHPDLPRVFRRIASVIAHTKEAGTAFFYWAAAEEFIRTKRTDLLPEVAAGFCKLDARAYDADALVHLEDYLLAAHFEREALQLAERFLPAGREGVATGRLMPHAVAEQSELIFQLRLGLALRSETTDAGASPEALADALRQDIEDEIDVEAARRAALIIFRRSADPIWTRADFELVKIPRSYTWFSRFLSTGFLPRFQRSNPSCVPSSSAARNSIPGTWTSAPGRRAAHAPKTCYPSSRSSTRGVNPYDPSILMTRRPDFPDTSPTGRKTGSSSPHG